MNAIYGLIAALIAALGYGWFQKTKKNTAEARNSNLDTESKLLELDKTKTVDTGDADRVHIEEGMQKDVQIVGNKELEQFFTDWFKKK